MSDIILSESSTKKNVVILFLLLTAIMSNATASAHVEHVVSTMIEISNQANDADPNSKSTTKKLEMTHKLHTLTARKFLLFSDPEHEEMAVSLDALESQAKLILFLASKVNCTIKNTDGSNQKISFSKIGGEFIGAYFFAYEEAELPYRTDQNLDIACKSSLQQDSGGHFLQRIEMKSR